ncbi:MAG: hypothetical protein NC432_03050 [Roseburia sp.]|nr:hypothetical protein [Roseburia sp.]MCM1097088.1 hypothetical protein [Ruminococcus flavefaciens]
MKNKLYYVLFLVYAVVVAFVLYVNGVFTGEVNSAVNLGINLGFLILIGVLFFISFMSFGRLNRVTDELMEVAEVLQGEYKEGGNKNLWPKYQDRKDVFESEELRAAFGKYRMRIRSQSSMRGVAPSCELDEYINENLLDRIGMNFFNSGISGTMTGLGILGTFLGLSMGLGSFNGDDIYTISDNVGPLLSGMKVAFHTSVYGIIFSLVFNFVYRSIMADAYEKLEIFLNVFRQTTQPPIQKEDENSAAMVVYQAGMSNALKQMLDLMKGNAAEQTEAVGRIADRFCDRLETVLGADFQRLGNVLKAAGEAQQVSAENASEMIDAVKTLVEVNRDVQAALAEVIGRQERFAGELKNQKEQLEKSCSELGDEISGQLYALGQMRNLYEK